VLRGLPAPRRAAIGRAVRRGEAVADPRDAGLAVAMARQLIRACNRPPARWWLRSRRGARRVFHVVEATLLAVGLAVAGLSLPGLVRWVAAIAFAYAFVVFACGPWFFGRLADRAAGAERRNLELLDEQP
jgi:hypothetical protein